MTDVLGSAELRVMLAVCEICQWKSLPYGTHWAWASDISSVCARSGSTKNDAYTTMHRLRERGMLTMREGQPINGGHSKKYFALTAKGARSLVRVKNSFQEAIGKLNRVEMEMEGSLR